MTSPPLHVETMLVEGTIRRRYQRFLADVTLSDGREVVAHCANTGTMRSCWEPGDRVLLRVHQDPRRKLPYTWIACQREHVWVGIDTTIPNRVVTEAASRGILPGLGDLTDLKREVPYGHEGSRIDLLARDLEGRQIYIEVKNTTLRRGSTCLFPDAVTTRGVKHLRELQAMVTEGHRAVVLFFVNRGDVERFSPARDVDPAYGKALDAAVAAGVEVMPWRVRHRVSRSPEGHLSLAWFEDSLLPWE